MTIEVRLHETVQNDRHWQFCVGSCHAPLAHRVDYLRKELGITRVRFHGLFNDDMKVECR